MAATMITVKIPVMICKNCISSEKRVFIEFCLCSKRVLKSSRCSAKRLSTCSKR